MINTIGGFFSLLIYNVMPTGWVSYVIIGRLKQFSFVYFLFQRVDLYSGCVCRKAVPLWDGWPKSGNMAQPEFHRRPPLLAWWSHQRRASHPSSFGAGGFWQNVATASEVVRLLSFFVTEFYRLGCSLTTSLPEPYELSKRTPVHHSAHLLFFL